MQNVVPDNLDRRELRSHDVDVAPGEHDLGEGLWTRRGGDRNRPAQVEGERDADVPERPADETTVVRPKRIGAGEHPTNVKGLEAPPRV